MDDGTILHWWKQHEENNVSWAELGKSYDLTGNAVRKRVRNYLRKIAKTPRQSDNPLLTAAKSDTPLDKVLHSLVDLQDAQNELSDDKPVIKRTLAGDKPVGVVFTGDWHVGGGGVDHKHLLEDLEIWSQTDGLYVIHLGDWAENFLPKVLPSAVLGQLTRPRLQWELVEHLVEQKLKTKLLAGVIGNHDAWSEIADSHPLSDLLKRQGIPFLGHGGRIWLTVGSATYKIEARHQYPYKSSLNVTNTHRNLFTASNGAHIVATAHLHTPICHYERRGEWGSWWLQCGTYKQQDPWAQSKGLQLGYAVPPPEMPLAILSPDEEQVICFPDFRYGLPLLKSLRGG